MVQVYNTFIPAWKLNQRKGDKYLRLNPPGYEVDSM